MKNKPNIRPSRSKYRNVVRYLAKLLDSPEGWVYKSDNLLHIYTAIELQHYLGWFDFKVYYPHELKFDIVDRWRLWRKAKKIIDALKPEAQARWTAAIEERLAK